MKQILQTLLTQTYNDTNDINTPHTLGSGSKAYIRFELGGELPNGSSKRVEQATRRCQKIFEKCFVGLNDIWVLVYDYEQNQLVRDSTYLYKQLQPEYFKELALFNEAITNNDLETVETNIVIGKPEIELLNTQNFFEGIANSEMGLEPSICQSVYFISPVNGIMLHMYDDRGCNVISPEADYIRSVYNEYNSWILEYNREEIDAIFS